MPKDETTKVPRKAIATQRFVRLTKDKVKDLGFDPKETTVASYIELLRDEALDEMGI